MQPKPAVVQTGALDGGFAGTWPCSGTETTDLCTRLYTDLRFSLWWARLQKDLSGVVMHELCYNMREVLEMKGWPLGASEHVMIRDVTKLHMSCRSKHGAIDPRFFMGRMRRSRREAALQ